MFTVAILNKILDGVGNKNNSVSYNALCVFYVYTTIA